MAQWFVLSLFLYFPEDKTEYIPAMFSFAIFLILCVLTFLFIIRYSKREAKKAKELEERIDQQQKENS